MRVNLLDIQLIKYQHELRTSQYLLLGILHLIKYIPVVSIQYGNQTPSHKLIERVSIIILKSLHETSNKSILLATMLISGRTASSEEMAAINEDAGLNGCCL